MRKIIGIFIYLICTSCSSDSSTTDSSRYYDDIDLFQMKGINEIVASEVEYPYIQMDSMDSCRVDITYRFDSRNVHRRSYERVDSIWSSLHTVEDPGEGATFYFYEYISKNWRMVLEYKNDPTKNGSLSTLTLLDRKKVATYVFEDDVIYINPSSDLKLYPLDTCFRKELCEWNIYNGILTLNETYIDTQTDKVEYKESKCYQVGQLSYFWWAIIGHKLKKVDCAS